MKFFVLLVLSLPFFAVAQKKEVAEKGFVIDGKIKAVAEGSDVILTGYNLTDTLATAKVKQGKFLLKGTVKNTDASVISFPALNRRLVLFMGNDHVVIDGEKFEYNSLTIKGSPSNAEYEEFLYYIKPLNDYVTLYRNQLQAAENQQAKDSAIIALNAAYGMYQESIDRFLERKKNSPVSALLLAYYYDTDPNKNVQLLEKRYNSLAGDALQSQFAKNLQTVIANDKVGAIGSKAIDFTQTDMDGKQVSLSQFKGKYVLLDFWASWCRPCRMENPNVVAAYNQFKDKNFTILSVSLDQQKDNWLNAIKADNLTWTHVSDLKYWQNAAAQSYHVQSIPQNYLVDPNGVIIAKNLRGEDLAQALQQLLK